MTPNERRDIPWIIVIAVGVCLAVIFAVAWYAY
jgi:hypothetical protein